MPASHRVHTSLFCGLFISLFSLFPVTGQPAAPVLPEMSIPLLQKPPLIDGKISEDEWSECLRGIGLSEKGSRLSDREAIVWLGCDGVRLYLAMQSETPPLGALLTRVKPAGTGDRAVHRDDCIELWLAPGRKATPQNRKFYQIAVNPLGALYDVCHDPDNPQLPLQPGWRVNWEYAGNITANTWQAEISIPLSELEVTPDDLFLPWHIRIGRNWQQPSAQAEWAPRAGGFADLNTMTRLNWLPEGSLVRMLSLRQDDQNVEVSLEVLNRSGKTCLVSADLFHRTSDNPHNTLLQTYTLAPGAKEILRIRDALPRGSASTSIRISDAQNQLCYFRRAFEWQVEPNPARWQAIVEDIQAVTLNFAYYPSFNQIKARLDISGLESRDRVSGAVLQLRPRNGRMLCEKKFPEFSDWRSELRMDIPELPEGEYELLARLEGQQVPAEAVLKSFTRQKFPWENNTLGIHEGVIPPFLPLQVSEAGRTISSVLREHTLGLDGLWQQVKSQGENLLAAPMHFDIQIGGRNYSAEPAGDLRFTSRKEHEVTWQTTWKAGPLSAQLQIVCEMDGMMKISMDLEQQGNDPVERLDLVIPCKKQFATLLHACGPGLRSNYAGRLPPGEGEVWDSRKTGSHLVGTFVPYLWLGSENRGIAWFAESDRDWLYDDKRPAQSILRRNDSVELRVHFVNRPAPLQRKRRTIFALQATPSKPQPGEPHSWRNWVSRTTDEGKEPENWQFAGNRELQHWRNWVSRTNQRYSPRAFTHFMLAGPSSWGTDGGHAFIYPVKRDFEIYALLQETRRRGERDLKREEAWFTRYEQNLPEAELKSRQDHIRWAARNLAGKPDAVVPYTDPRAAVFNPEFATFQDEWLVSSYSSRNWDFNNPRGAVAYQISPGRSFQDYQIWYIRKMLETFADAIYFDNTYLLATEDPMLGAYLADDNSVRPAVDIFNMRQHLKRVQTLTWQLGKNWLASMSHMTNAQIVPINTWCGTNLDWEWKYGSDDFQDRFSRDMIRTTAIGSQTGSVPFVLGTTGIRGQISAEKKQFLLRSLTGTSLVHEIKNLSCDGILGDTYARLYDFGYGSPACRVLRYWDADFPLSVSGVDAEGLLLLNNGEALLLLVNFADAGTASFSLDGKGLDLKKEGRFRNAETGEILSDPGVLSAQIKLPRHDFVLLHYQ